MSRAAKVIISVMVACIIGLGGFIGGFAASTSIQRARNVSLDLGEDVIVRNGTTMMGSSASGTSSKKVTLSNAISSVYQLMKEEGYSVPSETTATVGALNGLLQSTGDTHSRYLPASDFKDYSEEISGEFGGIGVVMSEKDGTAYVVEVYKGTPADKAGIKAGDIFYAVDGKASTTWTTTQIQKLVKGKAGTKVKLTMIRPAKHNGKTVSIKMVDGKKYTVTCTRAMITVPNVKSSMKSGNVGYIRLGEFNSKASSQVEAAVKSLEKKGATSLVLDLRENPGGLITEAVKTASLFIDKGTVVTTRGRDKNDKEVMSVTGNKITDLPLVVLVDENSASASEIVSGALQDHKRATLVGSQTYGKGSVQAQYSLTDGSAVLLTIQHYFTPKGRDINGKGLTPDIKVSMDVEKQASAATDTQLKRALQEARKKANSR